MEKRYKYNNATKVLTVYEDKNIKTIKGRQAIEMFKKLIAED